MSESIHAFQARAERALAEHDDRVRAPLERELARAKRALAVARAELSIERARYRVALKSLETLHENARKAGPGREWFTAIVALESARRADPDQ